METIVDLIISNGLSVVLIAFYMWKDYRFTGQISSILTEIKSVLTVLKDVEISGK